MKLLHMSCVLAAIALPGWAQADEAAPEPSSLATIDAIFGYCAKVDSELADKYKEQVKLVAQSASEEVLTKVRASSEYQQARDSMEELLSKADPANAKKACAQHLAQAQ